MPSTPEPDPPGTAEPPDAPGIDTAMQPQPHTIPQARHTMPLEYDQTEFDIWLRKQLNHLHSAVLSEPVPQSLLDILQQAKPD
jgi:hypothetical protein